MEMKNKSLCGSDKCNSHIVSNHAEKILTN